MLAGIEKHVLILGLLAATITSTGSFAFADANTPAIKGLAHICVYTKDIAKSLAFYTDTLGFKLIHQTNLDSGFKFVMVRQGTCIIEILEPKDANKTPPRTDGVIAHIALEVTDINATFENLKAKGVKFNTAVMEDPNIFGGVKIAFFRGPSGETFELFQYLRPVPGLTDTPAKKE